MNDSSQEHSVGPAGNVSLVVVTHNSATVLSPMLETLSLPEPRTFRETVFVDNGSSDGTRDLINERLPQARLIVNGLNRGFATAVNQGVRESSGQLILLANPDVRWSQEDVPVLAQFLDSHGTAAAVCPRLVYPEGGTQPSVRRFPTHANIWFSRQSPLSVLSWMVPSRHGYTLPDPSGPSCVEGIAATFMLIRREAFLAVGGMDEGYFLYVEDTDLCKRWHDAGYEVWIDPRVVVTHDWQGGSGKNPGLRRHHRDGVRRYFRTHHADKPLRNALIEGLLHLMDWWDHLRYGR